MMNDNRIHRGAGGRDGTAGEPDQDTLGSLLRDADPAADRAGIDAVERARMRQAVTEAASRSVPGRSAGGEQQAWMRPALAAVALALVALGVWSINGGIFVGPTQEMEQAPNGASQPTVPEPTAAAPEVGAHEAVQPEAAVEARTAPTTPDPTSEVPPATTTPDAVAEALPGPTSRAADDPTTPIAPAPAAAGAGVAAADDPSPTDRQPRTVQFTTPRGTRIIWTLDPNYESPIAGREPRQEQPR